MSQIKDVINHYRKMLTPLVESYEMMDNSIKNGELKGDAIMYNFTHYTYGQVQKNIQATVELIEEGHYSNAMLNINVCNVIVSCSFEAIGTSKNAEEVPAKMKEIFPRILDKTLADLEQIYTLQISTLDPNNLTGQN